MVQGTLIIPFSRIGIQLTLESYLFVVKENWLGSIPWFSRLHIIYL
jgi:hypothetical protein